MNTLSSNVLSQAALSVAAHRRIKKWLIATPCLATRQAGAHADRLYLKAENLQRTGSFKYRGALSKLTTLAVDKPIITASSGNHGLAVAQAAAVTGHQLRVVLPENVATEKHQKIAALGVETILHSCDAGQAELHAQSFARDHGLNYVSPYDDEEVVAGQGTIALELLQQLDSIDSVFVSMGGGGLLSGIGSVLKAFSPQTRVIGVSARNSGALAASIQAKAVVQVAHLPTLADGCAGSVSEGTMTLPLAIDVVDDIIECSESEIADGMRAIAWEEKMLVEGSAGLAYIAFQKASEQQRGSTSVVILCGSNFDREVVQPIVVVTR